LKHPAKKEINKKYVEILVACLEHAWIAPMQGRIQKFFEGGVLKNFCIDGKI